jgi:pilus assembly protein Flp/PilA
MEGNMLLHLWAKKEAFFRSDEGATAVEYGLIIAAIAIAISIAVFLIGSDINATFTTIDSKLAGG